MNKCCTRMLALNVHWRENIALPKLTVRISRNRCFTKACSVGRFVNTLNVSLRLWTRTIPEILIAQQRDFVKRKLKRFQTGALPLIHDVVERIGLREILYNHIRCHGNEDVPAVETLILLIFNLTRAHSHVGGPLWFEHLVEP